MRFLGPLEPVVLAPGLVSLPGFVEPGQKAALLAAILPLTPQRMITPGGKAMSVAMTSLGDVGWISDRTGYRYAPQDPATGRAWPAIPAVLAALARAAAAAAGFPGFEPDSVLVNHYDPGARMGLHQDRDEADFGQPIVSFSLGRAARFRWRLGATGPTQSLVLEDRDGLVFGGPARLMRHGIDRLVGPADPDLGERRINLTCRRATPTPRS